MRKRVNWVKIVHESDNVDLQEHFFKLVRILHGGRFMSFNRCAYNALKNYYSTTTIDELLEKIGEKHELL